MDDKGIRYVNQTQLAELKVPPVTRQAIKKAIGEGRLILHGEGRAGRIDLECPLTRAYLATIPNAGRATGGPPSAPVQKKIAKVSTPASPSSGGSEKKSAKPSPSLPSNDEFMKDIQDNVNLKTMKIKEELEKLKLNNQARRNELIERGLVQAFVHSMHEIDNAQWGTLDLKISSDLGAVLDIEDDGTIRKIADVVKREVRAILKQVKEEQNKFLKGLGAQPLSKGHAA